MNYGPNKRRSCNWVVSHLRITAFYAKQTAPNLSFPVSKKHHEWKMSFPTFTFLRFRVKPNTPSESEWSTGNTLWIGVSAPAVFPWSTTKKEHTHSRSFQNLWKSETFNLPQTKAEICSSQPQALSLHCVQVTRDNETTNLPPFLPKVVDTPTFFLSMFLPSPSSCYKAL